jgi:hypothetical protein
MSNELSLFENMPDSYRALLSQLEPEKNLTGGEFNQTRRLSIRGGVFRKVINGKEAGELEERKLNVVVVKAAPISRMYYRGTYVAGESNPPTCWSGDTTTGRPAPEVFATDRQSETCFDCEQNIKGSGMGEGRACRFRQRVALLLADADGKISSNELYVLDLPATSVFGDDQKKMSMQAYARHLNGHNTPLAAVVTEMRFDTTASTPKLCFKPIRPLEETELNITVAAQKNPETQKLVALTVKPKSEDDKPALPPAKKEDSLFGAGEADEDEAVDEPKVKVSKKKAAPEPKTDLSSLLDEFDD